MKAVYDKLADVPEAFRPEYEERDGKYALKIEGDHPTVQAHESKVREFRTTNVGLMKERDELREAVKRYDGVDLDEYRALKARIADLEGRGIRGGDDVAARVAEAVKPLKDQLEAITIAKKAADEALARESRRAALVKAGADAKVEDTALEDFVARGERTFQHENGKLVAKRDGTALYGDKGEPLTVKEWAAGLQKEAPHLFRASTGAGAAGGAGAGAGHKPGVGEYRGGVLVLRPEEQDAVVAGKAEVTAAR